MHTPRFYFTIHPGDMMRTRILPGASVMLVASAHWDERRGCFPRLTRQPAWAEQVASICIDSGGFTAARRWGQYPWTPAQYADFVRRYAEYLPLDFCAIMDYACEPGVDRSTHRTNRQRIKATIRNERTCREAASDLPWLSVLQGDAPEERVFDLDLRARLDMLPAEYAGIGSMCGRGAVAARNVVKFYADHLPGVRFHGFGMHVRALDDDAVYAAMRSWDSYGWSWGRGQKDVDRPAELYHQPGETWSTYARRLAEYYWQNTVLPRLTRTRQASLW